MGKTLALDNGR